MKIEDWIYRTFNEVLPYGNGSDLRVNCPFCEERAHKVDVSHHLHISLVKETCHCFRCDYSGSWLELVSKAEGVSFRQAHEILDGNGEDLVPLYILRRRQRIQPIVSSMPDNFMTIHDAIESGGFAGTLGNAAMKYVKYRLGRMIPDYNKYYQHWGIWNDPTGWGRLVLPVERGWWQYRNILKHHAGPKYISCSNPKSDRLYNYTALDLYDEVCIAEGVLSAACIGPDAIALCGKTATPEQVKRLGNSKPSKFILCLDPEAIQEALEMAETLLRYGRKIVEVRMYIGGDPASTKTFELHERFTPDRITLGIIRSRLSKGYGS